MVTTSASAAAATVKAIAFMDISLSASVLIRQHYADGMTAQADARRLEAAANPTRLTILDVLFVASPLSTDEIARRASVDSAAAEFHMAELFDVGLVAHDGDSWVPTYAPIQVGDDADSDDQADAAELMEDAMHHRAASQARAWSKCRRDAEWAAWNDAAASIDGAPTLTPDGLRAVAEGLIQLIQQHKVDPGTEGAEPVYVRLEMHPLRGGLPPQS